MPSAPSSLPRDFHARPAGAGMAQGVSPYFIPRRCSGHANLHSPLRAWGTRGQGAAWLENPHTTPLTSLQSPLGMVVKPQRGDREKQQGMSEAKGKTHSHTHGTSPSSMKRACCGHGVSGDCLDPVAKTVIACLGHL